MRRRRGGVCGQSVRRNAIPSKKKASPKTGLKFWYFIVILVRPERFERPTPWFVAKYSIQLSYGRFVFLKARIIHKTRSLQHIILILFYILKIKAGHIISDSTRQVFPVFWCARSDSNARPLGS
jgi:hypothetical protein